MAGFFQNLLKDAAGGFFGSDYLRDYTHAAKTFRPDAYANAPKFKFLFHTYFKINTEAYPEGLTTGRNFGVLVKEIKLPSYKFDTHEMNQYNRKRIIQTKIRYEPISITFHDDNNNIINQLWQAYYTYYYQDGNKPLTEYSGARSRTESTPVNGGGGSTLFDYNKRTQYQENLFGHDDWGYIGATAEPGNPDAAKIPFFDSVNVFGFNQKNFVVYSLINPIITNFNHDTYNYDEGSGVMKNQMTIDYETVVYNYGALDGREPSNIIAGFGEESNYDRRTSPIAVPGANGNVLGKGGLIDSAGGAINKLANGDIFGAIKDAGSIYYNNKDRDLKSSLKQELVAGLQNQLQNTPNRNNPFEFPSFAQSPGPTGTAGQPNSGLNAPPSPQGNNKAGQQLRGGG